MSWTTCTRGHRHWGPLGAAGVLVADADGDTVLLQLRSPHVHRGGTWALPGGAIERGETAVEAALREAWEECGIRSDQVEVGDTYAADCGGGWVYTTVLARPTSALVITANYETTETRWVAPDDVASLPLLPSFARAWPDLRLLL